MSTQEKKVTEEQLAKIKEQQVTMNNKLRDIGLVLCRALEGSSQDCSFANGPR